MTIPYYSDELVTLYRANALDLPLDDESVDLVVTSPPYFGLRSYQDGGAHYGGQIGAEATPVEFVDALIAATREMIRVVNPLGSIWVNLGDKYSGAQAQNYGGQSRAGDAAKVWAQTNPKNTGIPHKSLMGLPWRYAIRCIDELGLVLRAEVIWSKPNGLPESVADRVRRSHEHWFHFTISRRYFSAVDEIRVPHVGATSTSGTLGKLPGSVWTIPTEPLRVPDELGIDHFAAFPTEWPRRIISGWCPDGGTVLDPFSGTGTTVLVASALGRHGIGADLSADYCRLARWRVTDSRQRNRAAGREYQRPVDEVPGQFAMDFGGGCS